MESVNRFPVCYWEEKLVWFLLMFLLQCHELVRPQRWRLLFLRNFVSGCRQHNFLVSMALGHRSGCAGPNSKYIAWIFYFPAIKANLICLRNLCNRSKNEPYLILISLSTFFLQLQNWNTEATQYSDYFCTRYSLFLLPELPYNKNSTVAKQIEVVHDCYCIYRWEFKIW